jgi:hypothetical protein
MSKYDVKFLPLRNSNKPPFGLNEAIAEVKRLFLVTDVLYKAWFHEVHRSDEMKHVIRSEGH